MSLSLLATLRIMATEVVLVRVPPQAPRFKGRVEFKDIFADQRSSRHGHRCNSRTLPKHARADQIEAGNKMRFKYGAGIYHRSG